MTQLDHRDRQSTTQRARRRMLAATTWLCALGLALSACAAETSSSDSREFGASGTPASLPPASASPQAPGATDSPAFTPAGTATPSAPTPPTVATPIDSTPPMGNDDPAVPPVDAGGAAGAPAPIVEPPAMSCMPSGDASEVVMIGDSYLALNGETARTLEALTGRSYRHYYVSGTQLVGGFPPNIPSQYNSAIADGPIQTVIMDGGGNDVILGNPACRSTGPSACEGTVAAAVAKMEEMLAQMAGDGVKDVIYFFYPHLPNANLSAVVDYALPLVRQAIETCAPGLRCHFIDTVPAFEGKNYIGFDGIHPTNAGSAVIGELIYGVLEADACIFR